MNGSFEGNRLATINSLTLNYVLCYSRSQLTKYSSGHVCALILRLTTVTSIDVINVKIV